MYIFLALSVHMSLPLILQWPKSVTWPHPNEGGGGGEVKFYLESKGNQKYLLDSANNYHTTSKSSLNDNIPPSICTVLSRLKVFFTYITSQGSLKSRFALLFPFKSFGNSLREINSLAQGHIRLSGRAGT